MDALSFDSSLLVTILQIIAVDILLGGDNAVVIALACRRLPPELRNRGIFWGTAGAVLLRFSLVFFAVQLLALPFLKLIGGALLLWIGLKLLLPENHDPADQIPAQSHLLGAIRTIIVADAVMSIDNVLAIAGAADGHLLLVAGGVLISVPIIVWGSKLVLQLMNRYPAIITLGGGLLGWIAGGMWMDDVALQPYLGDVPAWGHYLAAALGALMVIVAGRYWAGRQHEP